MQRESNVSTQPRKNAAVMPTVTPMIIAIVVATSATVSETRAP